MAPARLDDAPNLTLALPKTSAVVVSPPSSPKSSPTLHWENWRGRESSQSGQRSLKLTRFWRVPKRGSLSHRGDGKRMLLRFAFTEDTK
jgi:hypothetical protein